jgi:cytoskeleton protein RodZ
VFLAAAGIVAYVGEYGLRLPGAVEARGPDAVAGSTTAADPGMPGTSPGPGQVAMATQGGVAAAVVPPGQVGLAFEFAADSWVEVYDGTGTTVLYDLGKAGTRREVAGVAPLSVTLGNAPGVVLSVNGRRTTVPPPPSGQTVVRFGIGPDGSPR